MPDFPLRSKVTGYKLPSKEKSKTYYPEDYTQEGTKKWHPGVGDQDDLQIRLVQLTGGSVVPSVHFGYYYIGDRDPIDEYYMFVRPFEETTDIVSAETDTNVSLSYEPTSGAPIIVSYGNTAFLEMPYLEQEETHTAEDITGYSGYPAHIKTYFTNISSSSVQVQVWQSDTKSWTTKAAPSDFIIDENKVLFSGSSPTITDGSVVRIFYKVTNSFTIADSSTLTIYSGSTGTHTITYELGYPAATPGRESYRIITASTPDGLLELNSMLSGAETGFLYLSEDNQTVSELIGFGFPLSDEFSMAATTPYETRRIIQFYSGTSSLPIYLMAEIKDADGNPINNRTVLFTVGTTTPEEKTAVTDMSGRAFTVFTDTYANETPITISCEGRYDSFYLDRQSLHASYPWEIEYQVFLTAVPKPNQPGNYLMAAWTAQGGKPVTSGQIDIETRVSSPKGDTAWYLISKSTTPTGPLEIPNQFPWVITFEYAVEEPEELRARYYLGATTPEYRYSQPIILTDGEGGGYRSGRIARSLERREVHIPDRGFVRIPGIPSERELFRDFPFPNRAPRAAWWGDVNWLSLLERQGIHLSQAQLDAIAVMRAALRRGFRPQLAMHRLGAPWGVLSPIRKKMKPPWR